MAEFEPRNPDFAAAVRAVFAAQPFSVLLGAELASIEPGAVTILVPFRDDLTQQHQFFHGGVLGYLADNACGAAAGTLAPAGAAVVTVEYKLNMLTPAQGEALRCHGRVVRAGRRLVVCQAEVLAVADGEARACALAQATMSIQLPTS